jgi:hypothetical protein
LIPHDVSIQAGSIGSGTFSSKLKGSIWLGATKAQMESIKSNPSSFVGGTYYKKNGSTSAKVAFSKTNSVSSAPGATSGAYLAIGSAAGAALAMLAVF